MKFPTWIDINFAVTAYRTVLLSKPPKKSAEFLYFRQLEANILETTDEITNDEDTGVSEINFCLFCRNLRKRPTWRQPAIIITISTKRAKIGKLGKLITNWA